MPSPDRCHMIVKKDSKFVVRLHYPHPFPAEGKRREILETPGWTADLEPCTDLTCRDSEIKR